ncbi:MAG: phage tail sheath C-terminal domain-containing protein [Acidobacteriota bacterium]
MAYKTPGVFVEEISTFPPSVVPVETAIPAFVGYTEMATGPGGEDLRFVPTRVRSLLDFETRFGGDFSPDDYEVEVDLGSGNAVGPATPRVGGADRRYYLYGCLRHFYANGGGPCYVVSVGSYADAPALGDTATPAGLLGGLSRVERVDEPTLLAFPDGVSLDAAELGSLQGAALAQCGKLGDRFLVADLRGGDREATLASDPVADFRQNVGTNHLRFGAAYYPWLRSIYTPEVRFRDLRLVDTADAPIPDGTLDVLTGDADLDALVPAVRDADADAASVVAAVDISGMQGADPLTLDRDSFRRLGEHFAELHELLRQTPGTPVAAVRQRFGNLIRLPRALALALRTLETATLPADIAQAVGHLRSDATLAAAVVQLIALEKNANVRASISTTRTVADAEADYATLDGTPWIAPNANAQAVVADPTDFSGGNVRATALAAASALQAPFDALAAALTSIFDAAEFLADEAQRALFEGHPVYRGVADGVRRTVALLPASGALAGVYAATDRGRGVWKAPANVSLTDVVGPALKVNDRDQEGLNVHSTGKSVNALRAFTGKGTLVWGARTLAGNDNEWRYVPVRRFFSFAEESIKKSTEPFVFEPNDAGTWIRVKAMVENFLTVQWRQGALAGATPPEAFFVKVGLGETMTPQDVLEGRMIVEIGMAVVRPAEFVILRFAHKMQVS